MLMLTQVKNRINIFDSTLDLLKGDAVFSSAFILAIVSCIFIKPDLDCINFKVLASLFCLMIVAKAFEELKILDKAAVLILDKCENSRIVSLVLILLTFFSSMFITNDVSLITFVPLTLIVERKSGIKSMEIVILQTIAANIGSSLTPMGNPQNLYIFSYYNLTTLQFFSTISIFSASGLLFLMLLNKNKKNEKLKLSLNPVEIGSIKEICIWASLFILIILSVFGIISYKIAFLITAAVTLFINKKIFLKVDYMLLITFVCFFVFIGNISKVSFINSCLSHILNSKNATYFGSIIMSQIISNVPCAVLLSKFTHNWKELLLGVDIGGMGTLIASLASVISYKFYSKEHPDNKNKYLIKFSIYNFVGLFIFTLVNYFIK